MRIRKLDNVITVLNFIKTLEFKNVSVKIFKVSMCFLIFSGVFMSQLVTNDNSENKYAMVGGIVTDSDGSLIPNANIIIEGTHEYVVMTAEDGSYSIKLPSDIYRIRVEALNMGFCPAIRSAVYLESNSTTRINFTLFGSYSVYLNQYVPKGIKELEHPLIGEFRFEKIFPSSLKKSKIKEIGIRYGEKKQAKKTTVYTANVLSDINKVSGNDYPGVLLTYNISSIQAQKITINSKGKIIAEGNVIVEENGKKRSNLKILQARIDNGTFVVE